MSVNRYLVLGFVVSLALAVGFFFLPKSVVHNNKKLEESARSEAGNQNPSEDHPVSPELTDKIAELKKKANAEKGRPEQDQIFRELGNAFLKNHQYDSAGWYFEKAAAGSLSSGVLYEAGSAYFEGIAFASNPSKVEFLSGKARELFGRIPDKDPKYTEAQAKTAMTWVNSESPMKGILKLRELAEKNPENEFVAYQLGILSFQSGQTDKAVARFRKVLELNPKNVNAWFFLAQCYQQAGNKKEALEAVQSGLPLAKEEDTKASFEELKKQLTEN